jgi:hypothetical protein
MAPKEAPEGRPVSPFFNRARFQLRTAFVDTRKGVRPLFQILNHILTAQHDFAARLALAANHQRRRPWGGHFAWRKVLTP